MSPADAIRPPSFAVLFAALLVGGCNPSSTHHTPPEATRAPGDTAAEGAVPAADVDAADAATGGAQSPVPDPTGPKDPAVPAALASPARWRLVELTGKPVPAGEDAEREAAITFVRDGLVHGSGSCNRFKGRCEFSSDDRLKFSGIASTKMACADMTVEQEFFGALEATDSYALKDGVLSLHRARMAPLARLEAVR